MRKPMFIWELPYPEKVAIAKKFHVRDADKLTEKQLDEKLRRDVHPMQECYEQVKQLGGIVPEHKLHRLEYIKSVLEETIVKVLKRVKEDTEVVYEGKRYTVTAVADSSTYGRYSKTYVLAPYGGGKPINVDWFKLAVEVYKNKK